MAEQAALYSPGSAVGNKFANVNLNSVGSQYAALNNHERSILIQKVTRQLIYDTAPQQFFDLKLLNMKQPMTKDSDEFFYQEMGYGRDPIVATGAAAAVAWPATQTFAIANVATTTQDMIMVYPSGARGTITAVDASLGTVTVTPMTNDLLPAVAVDDIFSNLSTVEPDAAPDISQYFRMETIERYNYVQMLVKAMRFGKMELWKYNRAGTTSNYLSMNKMRMLQQYRIDLSNILWNGKRGEVTTKNGKAKTAGGIYPLMLEAGSPSVSTPTSTMDAALEDLALGTEFKTYGATRFLFGAPRQIFNMSQKYKRDLTRYTPNDEIANLGLKSVNIGSTNIVFVPNKRQEDQASFPASWAKRMFLLDLDSITTCQCMGEEMWQTLSRQENGNLANFIDYCVSSTFSIEFANPLGGGWIDVQ